MRIDALREERRNRHRAMVYAYDQLAHTMVDGPPPFADPDVPSTAAQRRLIAAAGAYADRAALFAAAQHAEREEANRLAWRSA